MTLAALFPGFRSVVKSFDIFLMLNLCSFSGIFGHSVSLLNDGSLVICEGYRGDLLEDASGVANCISWNKDGGDDSWQIFATLR